MQTILRILERAGGYRPTLSQDRKPAPTHVAVEQWSRNLIKGHYVALLELHRQHELFAADWDTVLR